jgi:hypothetical protein
MVHRRANLAWLVVTTAALPLLGCTPDAEFEVHINAVTDVPVGTTVSYAALNVQYEQCGGGYVDAECENTLLVAKDVRLDLQHIVVDEVLSGHAPVDDIGAVWSFVDFADGCRLSPSEAAGGLNVDKSDDRVVYRFEGTYERSSNCSF